jgi:F-type H+-transporting ATPase subunit b
MQIDWFTVAAQTLNFLLLVWLLKRYLYGPILKAIDARECQIAKALSDADTIKSDAVLQRNLFEQKNIEIDTKRDNLLKEAKTIAREQSEKIVLKAHENADNISKSGLLALEKELQHYQDDIALKTLQEIYEIARKVLTDLADVELEQKMFECFCERLQNMNPDEKTNIYTALETGNTELLLCSAFELTQAQINKVDEILQLQKMTNFKRVYQLKYQLKTELISGIELRTHAWKIAWNTKDYLKVLQTHIEKLLAAQRETLDGRTKQLNSRLHTTEDSV